VLTDALQGSGDPFEDRQVVLRSESTTKATTVAEATAFAYPDG